MSPAPTIPPILDDTLPASSVSQSFADEKKKQRQSHHNADVVVIGAGVVGSALVVTLGDQDCSVILLEKSLKPPDRIVGELLQQVCIQALQKLGLGHCLEDIDAIPVLGYVGTYHAQPIEMPYAQDAGKGDGSSVEGRSFHHGKLVQALRMAAMKHKNVTVVEDTATKLIKNDWTGQILGVKTKANGFHFGSLTIVCDGCASRFRKDYILYTANTDLVIEIPWRRIERCGVTSTASRPCYSWGQLTYPALSDRHARDEGSHRRPGRLPNCPILSWRHQTPF